MTIELKYAVPWGRSCAEYVQMFALTPQDLQRRILDCAGGPASFNAEMTQNGHHVVSCDPLYHFSATEIAQRIQETYLIVIEGVRETRDQFVWTSITSPEQLGEIRMTAMNRFLADLPSGVAAARYVTDALPSLSFDSDAFDLALCSHFLFCYSDLGEDFHQASVLELCRVAKEVRIFPLLMNFSHQTSPWLNPVVNHLHNQGYITEIIQVSYEFQKGGNQLLRIYKQ